jgi:adenylyl-sulfate kinase
MRRIKERNFFTIWLTGLPCSGKTTIANALNDKLNSSMTHGRFVCLDGDDLRTKLNSDLGFTEEDRKENLRRVGHIAQLFNDKRLNALCSFVSPTESLREAALSNIDNVYLVYVDCSAKTCAERDVKGMWAKAKSGEIPMFTGYSAPYDIPKNPTLTVNTELFSIDQCVNQIIFFISNLGEDYELGMPTLTSLDSALL